MNVKLWDETMTETAILHLSSASPLGRAALRRSRNERNLAYALKRLCRAYADAQDNPSKETIRRYASACKNAEAALRALRIADIDEGHSLGEPDCKMGAELYKIKPILYGRT